MTRVTVLIDGFNLYHSLKQASIALGGAHTKWLDLQSLFQSYISIFGKGAQIAEIYYFSALAHHFDDRKPNNTIKHINYIDCLRSTGIKDIMGRFKYKEIYCRDCGENKPHYEEKETDVAISTKLLELFHLDMADTIVLVTGDTDLAPAVKTALALFPTKDVVFAFPYNRKNKELAKLASNSFTIKKERYTMHQLPDEVTLKTGRKIKKPDTW